MKKFLAILVAAMALFVGAESAQAQMKIVTGHPDLQVKVTRCAASGKVVILDMVFTNVGENDVEDWSIYADLFGSKIKVYDSEGNIYEDYNHVSVKVANRDYSSQHEQLKLISDVPMKVSVKITGVPENVESLARVDLAVDMPVYNIKPSAPIKIKNIPIQR